MSNSHTQQGSFLVVAFIVLTLIAVIGASLLAFTVGWIEDSEKNTLQQYYTETTDTEASNFY